MNIESLPCNNNATRILHGMVFHICSSSRFVIDRATIKFALMPSFDVPR